MEIAKNNTKVKVLVIIANTHGDFLLLKERTKHTPEPKYNFIRGTYDIPGEILIDTAKRECNEEAGIDEFEHFELESIREFYGAEKTRIYYIYRAYTFKDPIVPCRTEQAKLHEDISCCQWMGKEDILSLKESDFVDPIVYSIAQSILNKKTPY